jgi:hypothetical protein
MSEQVINFFKALDNVDNDIYRTYFLYRLWIKNKALLELDKNEFKKQNKEIYKLLGINKKFQTYNIIYPLKNYMKDIHAPKIYESLKTYIFKIDNKIKDIQGYETMNELDYIREYKQMLVFMKENTDLDKLKKKINIIKLKVPLRYVNININIFDDI